jgi:putative ABC transport system permease protein
MVRTGFDALRANPLRTALSALGVIIGVGAMVAVLALTDGVERAFRDRVAADGRLLTVRVAPRTVDVVDGQAFPRADWVALTVTDARALAARLGDTAAVHLAASAPSRVTVTPAAQPPAQPVDGTSTVDGAGETASRGVVLRGVLRPPPALARHRLAVGRFFTEQEGAAGAHVLVTDYALAVRLLADRGTPIAARGARLGLADADHLERLMAHPVWLRGTPWQVVGVLAPDAADSIAARRGASGDGTPAADAPRTPRFGAFVPIVALASAAAPAAPGAPPTAAALLLVARRVEDVGRVRAAATAWLAGRFGAAPAGPAGAEIGWRARAEVASYEQEGEEAGRGMLVFRLLMGAITGVSLVVGGVGIMNVLLASVSERTREIGVAKAVGARARDVALQFLAEAVAIAGAGAVLGTALGVVVAHAVTAVMRAQAGLPVRAGLSWATVLVAAGAPLVVGLVFGLYPALRAARLSPIDAIRHE